MVDQKAFSSNADSRQRVVAGDHSAREVSCSQLLDGWRGPRFQSILKDDQAEEAQAGFCLFA